MDTTSTRPDAAAAGTVRIGDREVNRLGYGAMRLTGDGAWGPPDDPEEARRVLRTAVDELGIELIDTADSYGPHVNEETIAEALHPYPDRVLIATKGGLERPGPGEWPRNGRPEHLREALDGSLRRLRTDTIDLYQLHAPDPDVPLEDSLGALVRAREEGKIRWIGVSNFEVDELERAREIVGEIASVQNRYNVAERDSDPVVDWCEEHGAVFLPWAPLTQGDPEEEPIVRIADERGATPRQVALAWLLGRSPAVAPIPGTSDEGHLRQNVEAAAISLTDEEMARLDAIAG